MAEKYSLPKYPSVPGPVYFVDGCMKVTNASNLLSSFITQVPEGLYAMNLMALTLPYPSIIMDDGGRMDVV